MFTFSVYDNHIQGNCRSSVHIRALIYRGGATRARALDRRVMRKKTEGEVRFEGNWEENRDLSCLSFVWPFFSIFLVFVRLILKTAKWLKSLFG